MLPTKILLAYVFPISWMKQSMPISHNDLVDLPTSMWTRTQSKEL
jgi:hypothetical protein